MHKRDTILALFTIIVFSFSACKKESSSVKYNDMLVGYKESVDKEFSLYYNQVTTTLNNEQYSLVGEYSKILLNSISNQITTVKSIKNPPNGEDFKIATINYIESVSFVVKSYQGYAILSDEKASIEQLDSVNSEIKRAESLIKPAVTELISAQTKYARMANMKLENKNLNNGGS